MDRATTRLGSLPSPSPSTAGGLRSRMATIRALDDLIDPDAHDDPLSPLRWTLRSSGSLADALTAMGHRISEASVHALLDQMGYSVRTAEDTCHLDCDVQYRHVNALAMELLLAGQPVLSVDCRRNAGSAEGGPDGAAVREVADADEPPVVPDDVRERVADIGSNVGWTSVGADRDTAPLAVNAIRRWWRAMGAQRYPSARRLLVAADAVAPDSRLWKTELGRLAAELGLDITVSHLPAGRSKWSSTEHRLFSFATVSVPGRGLTSYRTVVDLSAAASTEPGLKVRAHWGQGYYAGPAQVVDADPTDLPLTADPWRGEWNYTLAGRPVPRSAPVPTPAAPASPRHARV